MGIKYCCVPTCRHELVDCLGQRTIPSKDVVVRDAWLEMLGLSPESFRSHMRVCNCHFHCCDAQPPQPHYCFPTHHKRDLPPAAGVKCRKKAEMDRKVGDVIISPRKRNSVAPSRETRVNGFVDWYQTEVAENQVQLDDEGGNWEVAEGEEEKPSVGDSDSSEWLFSTFDPAVHGELGAEGLPNSSKGDKVKPKEEFVNGDYHVQSTSSSEWSYYEIAKDWDLHLGAMGGNRVTVEELLGAIVRENGLKRSSNVRSLLDGVSKERRCGSVRGDSSRKERSRKMSPNAKDSNPVMDVDDANNVVVDLEAMNSLLTDSDEDSTAFESSQGVRNDHDAEPSSPHLVLMSKDDLIKRLFAGLVQMKAKNKKARRRMKELDEEIKQLREELAKRSDFIIS